MMYVEQPAIGADQDQDQRADDDPLHQRCPPPSGDHQDSGHRHRADRARGHVPARIGIAMGGDQVDGIGRPRAGDQLPDQQGATTAEHHHQHQCGREMAQPSAIGPGRGDQQGQIDHDRSGHHRQGGGDLTGRRGRRQRFAGDRVVPTGHHVGVQQQDGPPGEGRTEHADDDDRGSRRRFTGHGAEEYAMGAFPGRPLVWVS